MTIKARLKRCKKTKLRHRQYLKSTNHIKSENAHVKNIRRNTVLVYYTHTSTNIHIQNELIFTHVMFKHIWFGSIKASISIFETVSISENLHTSLRKQMFLYWLNGQMMSLFIPFFFSKNAHSSSLPLQAVQNIRRPQEHCRGDIIVVQNLT